MNDAKHNLGEVHYYPRVATIIGEATKKKCVRFKVASLQYGEISYSKDYIVVLRSDAAEFLDRLLEREPRGVTGEQSPLALVHGHLTALSRCYPPVQFLVWHLLKC